MWQQTFFITHTLYQLYDKNMRQVLGSVVQETPGFIRARRNVSDSEWIIFFDVESAKKWLEDIVSQHQPAEEYET